MVVVKLSVNIVFVIRKDLLIKQPPVNIYREQAFNFIKVLNLCPALCMWQFLHVKFILKNNKLEQISLAHIDDDWIKVSPKLSH
jgi:hypothetical protein